MSDCPNKERNMAICNCSYEPCLRKGICCQCLSYHRKNNQLPACFFTKEEEKTYNRSISFFLKNRV